MMVWVSTLLLSTLGSSIAFQGPSLRSSPLVTYRTLPSSSATFSTLDSRAVDRYPILDTNSDNVGAWIPIASAHALFGLGPQQIRVMGLDLVVWNTGTKDGKWSVMADTCPHRLAPLSQGRVDPDTGCIECPYHGWQFHTEGNLTKLPHADPDIEIDQIPGSQASYFPTHLAGDMIYAFLPSSVHGEMFLQSVLPEDMFPTVRHDMELNRTYFVRELPYSADFVIENFMDPSHIPFAHHGLQSLRSDASPLAMQILVSNFTHVETTFEDYSRGVKRDGITSFQRPTMYHYRTRNNITGAYATNLNIHIVPVEAGRSRVMFGSVTFDWLPDWLRHAASNRFLNTDVWLHNAEYQARMRSSKYTPYLFATQSDTGVKAFRQWWSRHGFSTAPPNTFGPAAFESLKILDRSDQIDPWKNHSKQCASCRKALRVFQRIKGAGLASSIVSAIVFRRWPVLALFTVGLSLGIRHLSIQIASIIEGNPHPSGYADRSPAHQE